jgi:hypothetical protein
MNTEFWFENQKERGHLKNLEVDARLQALPLCIASPSDTSVSSCQTTPHIPEECRPRDRPILRTTLGCWLDSCGSGKGPVPCAIKTLVLIVKLRGVSL